MPPEAAPAAASVDAPAPPAPKGLYPRLLEAMRGLERVPERGWNEAQSYAYVREEDLVDAVRDRLLEAGVLLFPSLESIEDRPSQRVDRSSGAVTPGWPITRVVMRFKFVDAETGQSEEVRMPGDGSDGGDKGVYKALTGALKYVIRQPFLIATGDDAETDGDGRPAGARTGAAPTSRPPQQQQQRRSSGGGGGRTATEAQQRMMFARARSHGLSDAERDAVLARVAGASSLEEVPMDSIDAVLAAFAEPVPTGQSDVTPAGAGEQFAAVPSGAGGEDDDIPF